MRVKRFSDELLQECDAAVDIRLAYNASGQLCFRFGDVWWIFDSKENIATVIDEIAALAAECLESASARVAVKLANFLAYAKSKGMFQ